MMIEFLKRMFTSPYRVNLLELAEKTSQMNNEVWEKLQQTQATVSELQDAQLAMKRSLAEAVEGESTCLKRTEALKDELMQVRRKLAAMGAD